MRKSLGELINTALSDADSALKLASARDAEIRSSGDFLDAELESYKFAAEDTSTEAETAKEERKEERKEKKEEASEKKSSRSDFLGAASYAMKLAEALEIGAHVVAKVAADTDPNTHEQRVSVSTGGAGGSPLKAPGPQVMASGFIGAQTIQPKAQSAGAERITGPATTAGNMPTNIADHTGNLDGEPPPNNTGKTAGFTRSKEASARLLRAKQAQAETLMRMGQIKEAERLLAEVEKSAQDPSSPGPELPAHSNSYMLSTEPGDSTMIPDNSGLISMNKAQAKDRSVRTATEYVHEQPKLDNAVAAHALSTQGQKVSSLIVDAVEKVALNRSTVVSAGQKLGLIGGARAEKAFARSQLRRGTHAARAVDDVKKGLVKYETESPSFARRAGEGDFAGAIIDGQRAGRAGVKSAEAEKVAMKLTSVAKTLASRSGGNRNALRKQIAELPDAVKGMTTSKLRRLNPEAYQMMKNDIAKVRAGGKVPLNPDGTMAL